MIDIFNLDKSGIPALSTSRSWFERSGLVSLVRMAAPNVSARNLNAYVNTSVTRTRGFHVDTFNQKLKAFIYLTDVPTLSDGPYTYVAASHTDTNYKKINMALSKNLANNTEMPVVNWVSIVPVLGRKGTLVLSDQSGIHRGLPQAEGAQRRAIVMNYDDKILESQG